MKKSYKETWWKRAAVPYLFKNIYWLFIVLSLLIFMSPQYIDNDWWQGVYERIGEAVLASGVFAAVLKSFQFAGVFKDEIREIMLGTNFIKNRKDLDRLWKKTTRALYGRKFPRISRRLEKAILDSYLPVDKEYYYEDVFHTINIKEITDDFDIKYDQELSMKVVPESKNTKVELRLWSKITDNNLGQKAETRIVELLVDGSKRNVKEDQSTIGDPKNTLHLVPLSGKKEYNVVIKSQKQHSLKGENFIVSLMNTFVKNMDIAIQFPDNVTVSFFDIGVTTPFEERHVQLKNAINMTHRNNIIFPGQGFGMSFERD